MAIDLYARYPNNTDSSDTTAYPVGRAQNESFAGAKDWFPLEKQWINELLGFFGAILTAAGTVPDGIPETATASQYLSRLRALPVSLSLLSGGSVTIPGAANAIQLANDTAVHSVFSEIGFQAFSANKTYFASLNWEGIRTKSAGSDVDEEVPLSIDVSGLSWTHIGGSVYDGSGSIGLTDLPFNSSNMVFGTMVTGYKSSVTASYVGSVTWYVLTNVASTTVLSGMQISLPTDPASCDTLRLGVKLGRRRADATAT